MVITECLNLTERLVPRVHFKCLKVNGGSKTATLHYGGNTASCFGHLDTTIFPALVLVFQWLVERSKLNYWKYQYLIKFRLTMSIGLLEQGKEYFGLSTFI